jgi:hypothetical protein
VRSAKLRLKAMVKEVAILEMEMERHTDRMGRVAILDRRVKDRILQLTERVRAGRAMRALLPGNHDPRSSSP